MEKLRDCDEIKFARLPQDFCRHTRQFFRKYPLILKKKLTQYGGKKTRQDVKFISSHSLNYGLIGYPLGHSLSPFVHGELFKLSGITEFDYSLYETEPQKLEESYGFLDSLEGFNITIPHKKQIMLFCDELSEEAAELGAVNCVFKKKGYNTDVYGLMKSLEKLGVPPNSSVCVLGYGGAGQMAVRALEKKGANVTVAVREPAKVDSERKAVKLSVLSEHGGEFDLIINSTPVGMFPNTDVAPVSFAKLKASFVFDMIFNPKRTLFLKQAEATGAKTLNGSDMLVWQAVRAHEIWHGGSYTDGEVETLIDMLNARL